MEWKHLFQSWGHCWVFQICWHIECTTFTAPSFRIWNSSVGIPSPLLALFIVVLPKAHLTSHSRTSGSSWVITPLWLYGPLNFFLYSSSLYSFHLLISFASVRSTSFLSFIVAIFTWNVLLVSLIFFNIRDISNIRDLSSFLFYGFPLFLCINNWGRLSYLSLLFFGTLHSNGCIFPFPLPLTSLLFSAICKASLDNHFAFLHLFIGGWFWSLSPVQCHEPLSIVIQN